MTITRKHFALAAALAVAGFTAPAAQAALVTYDMTGSTSVGASAHAFTGSFTYDNSATGSTVYFAGGQQEGFKTTYAGAVKNLSITLDNGETVSAGAGAIDISNITQSENGAQVPQGLSLQAWTSGASGTINNLVVHNIYLAFLPMPVGMNWDALDAYYGTNAETFLKANPALLPSNIDPVLTGSALPGDLLTVFTNGLFLGTNNGLTNTLNTVTSMSLHVAPIPEPETYALMLAGLGLVGFAARRRAA